VKDKTTANIGFYASWAWQANISCKNLNLILQLWIIWQLLLQTEQVFLVNPFSFIEVDCQEKTWKKIMYD